MRFQGTPCWYELGTTDLDAAGDFYAKILGWTISDSGMVGFDYRLAGCAGAQVAGIMSKVGQAGDPPPNWLIYFAADDCDRTLADITAAGGTALTDPADIPGTGRFAIVADPQGAVFGLLQPDLTQMTAEEIAKAEAGQGAFDPMKIGHGNWNELMSTDPEAAFAFYAAIFGWAKGDTMDMGAMGSYQLLRHKGGDIGAIMGLGDAPVPVWLPYFGISGSVAAKAVAITAAGGTVHQNAMEVPGPAWIAVAQDPQGAWFAVVGPEA